MFAALDLGTNNCRLLIATPSSRGFRIVDAFFPHSAARGGRGRQRAAQRSGDGAGAGRARRLRRQDRAARRDPDPRGGDPGLPRRRQWRGLPRPRGADDRAAPRPDLSAGGGATRRGGLSRPLGQDGEGGAGAGCRRRLDRAVLGRSDGAGARCRSAPAGLLAAADPRHGVDPHRCRDVGRAFSGGGEGRCRQLPRHGGGCEGAGPGVRARPPVPRHL